MRYREGIQNISNIGVVITMRYPTTYPIDISKLTTREAMAWQTAEKHEKTASTLPVLILYNMVLRIDYLFSDGSVCEVR